MSSHHDALEHRQGSFVTQELIDGSLQQGSVIFVNRLFHQGQLGGVLEEGAQAERRAVHGGLVPGVEQEDARGAQFVFAEFLALILHADKVGDQVVLRFSAPLTRPARRSFP